MRLVDPTAFADDYLALEYLASEPYTSFVYESPAQARSLARQLFERGLGEYSKPFGTAGLDDDRSTVVGMLAYLDGGELRRARMDVAIALVREGLVTDDPMSERISLAAETMMAVDESDLYLARIAVADHARGRGIGTMLMAELERAARARGKTRLVLEVSPVHEAALKLYERAGFEVADEQHVDDPATGRSLAYRHMIKPLR
jgi:ribosomal protein S18 acetylase RimI-like enzyme